MSMTIDLNVLDPASIDAAIAKIRRAQNQLIHFANEHADHFGDLAVEKAEEKLADALIAGPNIDASVHKSDTKFTKTGSSVTVTMDGEHAGIIEFGSGIYYENPYQVLHGYFAGSFHPSSPYALQKYGWFYTGPPGPNAPTEETGVQYPTEPAYKHRNSTHTFGNPANRVMWNTVNDEDLQHDIFVNFVYADIFYD